MTRVSGSAYWNRLLLHLLLLTFTMGLVTAAVVLYQVLTQTVVVDLLSADATPIGSPI